MANTDFQTKNTIPAQQLGAALSVQNGVTITAGIGAPTALAVKGSLYCRIDGSSTSTRLYINSDGGTTWVAVTTAS